MGGRAFQALALGFIEATDSFLIRIVLFVIAQSLFALFVDDTLPLPAWREIHNLDDLKAKLISAVITVLAVLFLGEKLERVVAELSGPVCLDLAGLRLVDEAGLGALRALRVHGVAMTGASPYFRLLLGLEEPGNAREPPSRPGGRKWKGERGQREP